eukprot:TRINITY_DN9936_c0_g3_i1.p1 TRINITY_DN9936_c0_g3~~TRINITY_DN9936_c0_g3_i1.p1  ORF type:complete len:120 (+),score=1.97 TRINITY_DN9936_c0_g3_i1:353-712(+)
MEFCELCQTMGMNHSYSTKYHQQGNRQVESTVKTVKPILLVKLFKDKMSWLEALKAIESAYNKHLVSTTTGMSRIRLYLVNHIIVPTKQFEKTHGNYRTRLSQRKKKVLRDENVSVDSI